MEEYSEKKGIEETEKIISKEKIPELKVGDLVMLWDRTPTISEPAEPAYFEIESITQKPDGSMMVRAKFRMFCHSRIRFEDGHWMSEGKDGSWQNYKTINGLHWMSTGGEIEGPLEVFQKNKLGSFDERYVRQSIDRLQKEGYWP